LSCAEHDQVALVVSGRAEKYPGNPSAAIAVSDAGDDHDPAHVLRAKYTAFDCSFHATSAGAWNGEFSVMEVLAP
jgi:hypothetical protein